MQNKAEEALTEYEALSKQQPNAVGPHTVIAMLLQSMNRMDEAQKRYERVIQLDRQAPVAANNLAWMYAERGGNLDVALQLAQTARRNLPNAHAVADTLGWVYYKKQQYDMAIRELTDAVAKDPENPEYQYHLGAAYAAKGDVPKARVALQKAVARPFGAVRRREEGARRAAWSLTDGDTLACVRRRGADPHRRQALARADRAGGDLRADGCLALGPLDDERVAQRPRDAHSARGGVLRARRAAAIRGPGRAR